MRFNVTLDCIDPEKLAGFWSAALGFEYVGYAEPYAFLRPSDGKGPRLLLQRVPEPKQVKNRMHLDLQPQAGDIDAEVVRLKELGATQVSEGFREAYGTRWIVMADPEGNEFCVGRRA
ncbi:MAG: VOC family protein [Actinomycetota bacterium]